MPTLNYQFRDALSYLNHDGCLQVLIALILHGNVRNRCWPSTETLVKELGISAPTVGAGRKWLLEHRAIELVDFDKRIGPELELPARQFVYQLTGQIAIGGQLIPYLYTGDEKVNPVNDQISQSLNQLPLSVSNNKESISSRSAPPNLKFTRPIPKTEPDGDDDITYDSPDGKKAKVEDSALVVRLRQVGVGSTKRSNPALRNMGRPVQTPSGVYPSPNDLWTDESYFREWVESKIAFWTAQESRGDEGMIYLCNLITGGKTFNHPLYGYPAYQDKRRHEDLSGQFKVRSEQDQLDQASKSAPSAEVPAWMKDGKALSGGLFDEVAEE